MPNRDRDESFWDFSLRTYRVSGVPEACLALQDELGADVNMVLYCCWAGDRSAALDGPAFQRAFEFSSQWATEVVRPLRHARRWMKQEGCAEGPVDREACLALREQIKGTELAAEKLQQLTLAALPLPGTAAEGIEAVAANLRIYFHAIEATLDEDAVERLMVIVHAAFPRQGEQALRACARSLASEGS